VTEESQPEEAREWRLNYFNYFTEIEEQFQRSRGSALFLLSPLDWALIETWKNAGVPLEAALRGIEAAFVTYRQKKKTARTQQVNSLAYCAQAVMQEAESLSRNVVTGSAPSEDAFPREAVAAHLEKARAALAALDGYAGIAASVARLLENLDAELADLEQLDQKLTAVEEKMAAIARTRLADDDLFAMRRELDAQLRPYRGKMSAEQLARLEKSFLDRKVYEKAGLPRLSLFFMV
jgi:hypothetical protein